MKIGSLVILKDDGAICNDGLIIPHIKLNEIGEILAFIGFNKAKVKYVSYDRIEERYVDVSWVREASEIEKLQFSQSEIK